MLNVPQISGKEAIKALGKIGFTVSRQKGSHIRLARIQGEVKQLVTVPNHKVIRKGTLLMGFILTRERTYQGQQTVGRNYDILSEDKPIGFLHLTLYQGENGDFTQSTIDGIGITNPDYLNRGFGKAVVLSIPDLTGGLPLTSAGSNPNMLKVWESLAKTGIAKQIVSNSYELPSEEIAK